MEEGAFGLTSEELAALDKLTDGELVRNLALARGRGAMGRDLYEQGLAIFIRVKEAVQSEICNSQVIRDHFSMINRSSTMLLASLVDIVIGYLTGIAAASFCILLIREGLPEYCSKFWNKDNECKNH